MAFFRPLSSACAARVLVCASAWACVCVRVVLVRVCVCTRVPPRMLDGDSQPPSSLFHPVSLYPKSEGLSGAAPCRNRCCTHRLQYRGARPATSTGAAASIFIAGHSPLASPPRLEPILL